MKSEKHFNELLYEVLIRIFIRLITYINRILCEYHCISRRNDL